MYGCNAEDPWVAGQPYANFEVHWTRDDYNKERYSPRKVSMWFADGGINLDCIVKSCYT